MSKLVSCDPRRWVVEVKRTGAPCLTYVYNDKASVQKKYREVQKKYRGTNTMYRIIAPF